MRAVFDIKMNINVIRYYKFESNKQQRHLTYDVTIRSIFRENAGVCLTLRRYLIDSQYTCHVREDDPGDHYGPSALCGNNKILLVATSLLFSCD